MPTPAPILADDGSRLCRWCRTPVPKGIRFRYECSRACRTNVDVATGFRVRYHVRQRDKGVCALCGVDTRQAKRLWEADHVVPVAEGGGSCGLDGLRTLCTGKGSCHAKVTGELRKRLAEAAREPSPQLAPTEAV
jgi:5-methylcytosine-specific restriction endonuclease McrA